MKRQYKICTQCNREVSLSNYKKHIDSCNPKEISFKEIENGKCQCNICGKIYSKKGIGSHIWRMHTEDGKNFTQNHDPNIGYKMGSRKAWNNGLNKNENKIMMKMSLSTSETLKQKRKLGLINYKHSEETKKKISSKVKGKTGGYRKGGGIGKSGWYKDYWCDSSWELAFVIYNLEHNILFTRNTQKFEYEFEGKKMFYIPDFIMEDGMYVEIKGYETKKTKAKCNDFPHSIKLLKEKELQHIFDYVESKYGKHFTKLYESKD